MGREPEVQPIEEEADPVDAYKHVAVVDCSKAFSNQEVSKLVLKIFKKQSETKNVNLLVTLKHLTKLGIREISYF